MKRIAALLLALALAPAAFAADDDPPARVGRLAWIEGEALAYTDPESGWERAGINAHLTSENSVWTEPRSRAEVRAGSIALRLEESTQLDIVRLDDIELFAHLARGSLAVRVRYFERDEAIVVTTPEGRFRIRGNGRFRIDADAGRRESRLTVFEGSASLESSGGTVIVDTGRTVLVTGGERPSWEYERAVTTAIDEWALARDEGYREGQASRYVSPRMTGWEDLDRYGEWRDEPDYGTVWYPTRVEVGWAPYSYGRWTWVRPWGWTWVDDAPWGYAPFHYGRWVNVRNRWAWYPGRYDPRPVWAPALVGWVGGSGWSLTINSGPVGVVGWYPLSPWDRYEPWYRARPAYVTHVNRVVIVDRRPRYPVNHRTYATVATRDVFGSRRPVRESRVAVTPDVVSRQPVASGSTVLPPVNAWRQRPGTATPGVSQRPGNEQEPGAGTPARPPSAVNTGRPYTPPATPSAATPTPPAGRPTTRPRDEPRGPTTVPPTPIPTPTPQTAPPVTNAPARPAFSTRPQQVAPESSRPATPALPSAPGSAISPRAVPRTEPSAPMPKPAEAPAQHVPRVAPADPSRARPEAPRESRPDQSARPPAAPPSAAKPVERIQPPPAAKPVEPMQPSPSAAKPAERMQPQPAVKPPKEDKAPKESGQPAR
jgi:hypothetical protein